MENKGRMIFVSSLYILYILTILPWYFIFLFSSNRAKREINKGIINRELRKCGVPRDIRRVARKSYNNSVRVMSIRRGIKLFRLSRGRKKSKKLIETEIVKTMPN